MLIAPLPALAQPTPRSIADCEQLKNDLAYNQCLAMFGPAAKNVAGGFMSVDTAAIAEPLPQAEEAAETGEASPSGRHQFRSRHGRQYAVFTTGGGSHGYRHRRRRH